MTMRRAIHMGFLTAVALAILIAVAMLVYLGRELPGGMTFQHSIANGDDIRSGTSIIYRKRIRPHDHCTVVFVRRFVDSRDRVIATGTHNVRPTDSRERVTIDIVVAIPETASLGTASVHVLAVWRCNWVQELFPQELALEPVEFEIKP